MIHPKLKLQRLPELPIDLDELVQESLSEGHDMLKKLVDEWKSGINRFDQEGEVLYGVYLDGTLIAVGGRNRDPYIKAPGIGRIRHIYILKAYRRMGIGRRLVEELLHDARKHFHKITLRSASKEANVFYEMLGFERVKHEHATHYMEL